MGPTRAGDPAERAETSSRTPLKGQSYCVLCIVCLCGYVLAGGGMAYNPRPLNFKVNFWRPYSTKPRRHIINPAARLN